MSFNLIELTTNHTGKMLGIKSLSTSVLLNSSCQKNRNILGSICSHCYANALAQMYSTLGARLERNTKELTTRFLTPDDFKMLDEELAHEQIFRFEAFGDLENEIQMRNYCLICRHFPNIKFALYTKRYDLIKKYFDRYPCPSNLTVVISSLMLNKPVDVLTLKRTGKFAPGQLKVFTVYDKKYIRKHPELKINCGARSCNTCRLCYLQLPVENVNEILKSDRESATMIMNLQDPVKREKILDNLEEIFKVYK